MVSSSEPVNVQSREVSKLAKSKASSSSPSPWKQVDVDTRLSLGIRDQGQQARQHCQCLVLLSSWLPPCLPSTCPWSFNYFLGPKGCLLAVGEVKEEGEMAPLEIQKPVSLHSDHGEQSDCLSLQRRLGGKIYQRCIYSIRAMPPFGPILPAPHRSLCRCILEGCRHTPSGTELGVCRWNSRESRKMPPPWLLCLVLTLEIVPAAVVV